MNVFIKPIPHKEHRYPTCGDWWFDENRDMQIRVSQELPDASQQLVALHEYAEALMCRANGVTQKDVDDFDMNFEANRKPDDESEPGDHVEAPYCREHGFATALERMVATHIGVGWMEHEQSIGDLFK
jgi:hypothetical protein